MSRFVSAVILLFFTSFGIILAIATESGTTPFVIMLTTATQSGRATWFHVGLGACGYQNEDSDFIVALAQPNWDDGSHCNQQLRITNPENGRAETATVRDLCPGCSWGDLDLSPALFQALADNLDVGIFQMTWDYV